MAKLILKAPYYSPQSKTPNGNSRSGYANYIATRDGVEIITRSGMAGYVGERTGSNGLFSDLGVKISMTDIKNEIDSLQGNMWGLIISLTRSDAERLGYNSAEQWMNLLRSRRNDIASAMHIQPGNLCWYAAFHQKENHPHVHMLVWSKDPQEPYLSPEGIETIKKVLSDDIFRQDKLSIYQKQTETRDEIKAELNERLRDLANEIRNSDCTSPELEQKLLLLSERLKKISGKKVYGYLRANDKKLVNEIVKLIADTPKVAELYEVWYQCKCEVLRTYTDAMPEKNPLELNEDFKSVRNTVVKIAATLDGLSDPQDKIYAYDYEPKYTQSVIQKAKELFAEGKSENAVAYLKRCGNQGNAVAFTFLGDCYLHGKFLTKDEDLGVMYLEHGANAGVEYANYRLGKYYLGKSDVDERQFAEEYLQFSTEHGNATAAYSLSRAYANKWISGGNGMAKRYLRMAAELGFAPAQYMIGLDLLRYNPDEAKDWFTKAAESGDARSMYRLGKMLYEEGKTAEAIEWLEKAALSDEWAKVQLALFYYYNLGEKDKGMQMLKEASNADNARASQAIKHITEHRNALIVTGIANLFASVAGILEEDAAPEDGQSVVIDSRQKREIRAKRNAENLTM